jgi:hypothetical protein
MKGTPRSEAHASEWRVLMGSFRLQDSTGNGSPKKCAKRAERAESPLFTCRLGAGLVMMGALPPGRQAEAAEKCRF